MATIKEYSKTCMLCGVTFWSKSKFEEHVPDCVYRSHLKIKQEKDATLRKNQEHQRETPEGKSNQG